MTEGDIVDHRTDSKWTNGEIKQVLGDRAYVLWPENESNGYTAYSPHPISHLKQPEPKLF